MNVFKSALSLVIHKKGRVASADIDDVLARLRSKKGINIDRDRYVEAVGDATTFFESKEDCLFVCTSSKCLKDSYLHPSDASLSELGDRLGCQVVPTGCHYQCEKAPVVTLKTGTQVSHMTGCSSSRVWKEVFGKMQRLLAGTPVGSGVR